MNSVSNPLPDRVPIDMTKYPALKAMGKEAGPIVSNVFAMLDNAIASDHHNDSQKFFGMPIQDLITQLTEAMFDHKGIIDHLPNEANANALSEMYGHALNPLHAAFTKENLLDHKGGPVSFEEKFGMKENEYTVKRFIQGLLFYSYYCSLPDLAQAFAINDYALVDEEKHENIAKLLEIKPILTYQKAIGILPGKLYPDTGFFDGGDLKGATICPACKHPDSLISLGQESVCISCKGAFRE